ncbi:MAG: hypothetical protein HZB12_00040 [Candidatus Yonathbacteria bacterium]|nr:hypothetical protein [Candidatus Yonathbacteria bacterium]
MADLKLPENVHGFGGKPDMERTLDRITKDIIDGEVDISRLDFWSDPTPPSEKT